MASIYLDTSALLKLYIEEEGTSRVTQVTADADRQDIVILDIARVEFRSGIRRRERESDLTGAEANRVLNQLELDVSSRLLVQPSSSAVLEEATRLVDQHPLRALDALQLAGSLVFQRSAPRPVTFVSADTQLCLAAEREHLATLNPLE